MNSTTDGTETVPHGVVDLRGAAGPAFTVRYPADAVVVVSGLPGAGKSTLLRRWSGQAVATVDPRAVHEACEAVMPASLPYAVYRPWARLEHARLLRTSVRRGGPLLVHDCGSRAWMRRRLAREAARQGRELHLVLLDVGPATALDGQRTRGRHAPPRTFARHRHGLDALLAALTRHVRSGAPTPVPEAASVLLLDAASRSRPEAVRFGPGAAQPPAGGTARPYGSG
ncbi:AAA family ATPase [Kitasatospora aureofaciens]|uniref:AAA family ATPase n=1 Tax=Kitasatospora aureofaciens TaxID=1894 RepID=UPI001C463AB5|nr:AAA family ATPase [Kitasatospora aureofaciens]MBV6699772.1 AAA family ATPase [Kitasatospora aureofaciens]